MPKFRGAIFDVDGVLVDSPHEKAWREALRELMESDWSDIRDLTTWSPEAFTSRVYEEQMSGKPRMSGARAALEYFHVPDDEEDHRLLEYAERKQEMLVKLIEAVRRGGVGGGRSSCRLSRLPMRALGIDALENEFWRLQRYTDQPVAVQVLLETGLERFHRGACA